MGIVLGLISVVDSAVHEARVCPRRPRGCVPSNAPAVTPCKTSSWGRAGWNLCFPVRGRPAPAFAEACCAAGEALTRGDGLGAWCWRLLGDAVRLDLGQQASETADPRNPSVAPIRHYCSTPHTHQRRQQPGNRAVTYVIVSERHTRSARGARAFCRPHTTRTDSRRDALTAQPDLAHHAHIDRSVARLNTSSATISTHSAARTSISVREIVLELSWGLEQITQKHALTVR